MSESKSVEALQGAFAKDANAIQALIVNRVPCNQALADDAFVVVDQPLTLPAGNWQVGAIGLVNAVLAANGLPLIAVRFSDEPDTDGRRRLLGFCEYVPRT